MYDDILRGGLDEFRQFVNPLIANRAILAKEPMRYTGTKDGCILDEEYGEVEDFHGTPMLGHRVPEVRDALRAFLDSDLPEWWPSRVSPFAGRLAKKLHQRTGYDNTFFALSGSDGVEAAIKLSRALTGRPGILGLERAYHGCAVGSTALMGTGLHHDPFGPHLPGVRSIGFDKDALSRELAKGDVGAVIVEPIQGEGGVRVLPDDFVEALCELTERHGALLVADEVQTGLGRTGKAFLRSKLWPREPDVVILAKAIGGAYMPLSAMLTRREIFERAYGEHFATGEAHNITFSYNTMGMIAGLTALDLITDELIAEVDRKGRALKRSLEEALTGHPLVEELLGEGFMQGIKLRQPDHPWLSFEHFGFDALKDKPCISPLLCNRIYRRGFFCFTCGHDWSVFRLQPRFNISDEKLATFVSVVKEELDALWEVAQ